MTKWEDELKQNQQMLTEIQEAGIKKGKRLYQCQCGNQKWIRTNNVRSGRVKSCGCLFKNGIAARKARGTAIDESGNIYGALKVIARCPRPKWNHQRGAFWLCKCACGNTVKVYGGSLRAGKTTTCGRCPK